MPQVISLMGLHNGPLYIKNESTSTNHKPPAATSILTEKANESSLFPIRVLTR